MKKRIAGVALVFALFLALLPQRSLAAPSVNFTSVNDMLLDLNSAMPFLSEGEVYVSSAIFEARSGRTPELGIYFDLILHSTFFIIFYSFQIICCK